MPSIIFVPVLINYQGQTSANIFSSCFIKYWQTFVLGNLLKEKQKWWQAFVIGNVINQEQKWWQAFVIGNVIKQEQNGGRHL
jgi:hypothetical protein